MILYIIGNTRAGKTTLAKQLLGKNCIHLDGDVMRRTINFDLGFSAEDRKKNNIKVANLAKELESQGYTVIVSVICPYEDLRREVQTITGGKFIYITGGLVGEKYPFEPPTNAIITIRGNEIK